MAKIIAPNKEYNGVTATVPFTKGIGYTENEYLISWFKTNGYEVEVVKTQKETQKDGGEVPLEKRTNPQLIEYAKEKFDVEIVGTKKEMLEQIAKLEAGEGNTLNDENNE